MSKVGFKDHPRSGGKKIDIKFPKRVLKAGPPRCETCNSIMQIWIPAKNKDIVPPYNPFIWVCPNYCNIRKHGGKEVKE